jgi:secreted trypsin-like serine protease
MRKASVVLLWAAVMQRNTVCAVVGGIPVTIPQYQSYGIPDGALLCGATLIHPDVMLSAAHCLATFQGLFLRLSMTIGSKKKSGEGMKDEVRIESILEHPDYEIHNVEQPDIMLIKLNRKSVAPIVPWNDDPSVPVVGNPVTVIGFGHKSFGGDYSDELLQTTLSVIDFEKCSAPYFEPFQDATTLCAGTSSDGKGHCEGDSGGPLFTETGVLAGIVRGGSESSCGLAIFPGLYTRVSNYAGFIQKGVCALSDSPPADCPETSDDCPSTLYRCDGGNGILMRRRILGICQDRCIPASSKRLYELFGWQCGSWKVCRVFPLACLCLRK